MRKIKILQINATYDFRSTGRIMADIHKQLLKEERFEPYVIYGRGQKSKDKNVYKVVSNFYAKIMNGLSRLTGVIFGHCLIGTNRTIRLIKKIKPDIVHLHCPNGYFMNIPRVVKFLNKNHITTLITQHCEFFYTGNCGYALDCEKWKNGGCDHCPTLKQATGSILFDRTSLSFKRMKDAFAGFENDCYIVSCTPWLNERASESIILNKFNFGTIYNGTEIRNFHYVKNNGIKEKYNISKDTKVITYVNPVFKDSTKGGYNLYELAKYFENEDVVFLLVGNNDTSIELPKNVINVGAINNAQELARYYSAGDVSLLLSYRECFPMTVVEAVCCGTQVVGFKCGGPDKAYDVSLAEFVEHGNVKLLADTIKKHLKNDDLGKEKRAEIAASLYSKEVMANNYIKAYEKIIADKKLG